MSMTREQFIFIYKVRNPDGSYTIVDPATGGALFYPA